MSNQFVASAIITRFQRKNIITLFYFDQNSKCKTSPTAVQANQKIY